MGGEELVIQVQDLTKSFRLGFRMKRVQALRGVSFAVRQGEIFGFLGPNGAGKTTTIKTIVGLLRATSGSCTLLGQPVGNIHVRRHVGYLPESPYFYDHLYPDEFMDFCGRLRRLPARERRKRGVELLETVGLGGARDRPLRKFSKGMLQRIGLAQCLLGQPKLLILDEPMTGLDPVGRKEVRDLILSLRQQGLTIFFSSHILSDVELLCDRVAIVHQGRVVDEGSLDQLLVPEERLVDIELEGVDEPIAERLRSHGVEGQSQGDVLHVTAPGEGAVEKSSSWRSTKGPACDPWFPAVRRSRASSCVARSSPTRRELAVFQSFPVYLTPVSKKSERFQLFLVIVNGVCITEKADMAIKLSTKGRYGVRAMLDLALRYGQGPVLVRNIAERQGVSSKYLHALLSSLKAAKLVRSVRGSGGGYSLARSPEEICVSEVLEALEGPFSIVDCVLDLSVCDRTQQCAVRDVWAELNAAIEGSLSKITLSELLDRQKKKEARG